jgi:hypothetical protein
VPDRRSLPLPLTPSPSPHPNPNPKGGGCRTGYVFPDFDRTVYRGSDDQCSGLGNHDLHAVDAAGVPLECGGKAGGGACVRARAWGRGGGGKRGGEVDGIGMPRGVGAGMCGCGGP